MTGQVERLLGMGSTRRAGSSATPGPLRDGVVTRVDPDGSVWITPTVGGDARAPLGPCRGARVPALVVLGTGSASDADSTYRLDWRPLPVRTEVVFTVTARGVWVLAHDSATGRNP